MDRLLRTPFENYYQVLSTFVRVADMRKAANETPDTDGGEATG